MQEAEQVEAGGVAGMLEAEKGQRSGGVLGVGAGGVHVQSCTQDNRGVRSGGAARSSGEEGRKRIRILFISFFLDFR